MWQGIISVLGIVLLTSAHVLYDADPAYLFFACPFLLLLIFYLYLSGNRVSTAIMILCSLFLAVYAVEQTKELIYAGLILISAAAYLTLVFYQKYWNHQIEETESKLGAVLKDKKVLDERHRARIESLRHLEDRVNGLVHLFEIARDFNECISSSEILGVLDQKISQTLIFQRGTLILKNAISQIDESSSKRWFSFGLQKREDNPQAEEFANDCLNLLETANHVVRYDSLVNDDKGRLASYQTTFPVWLFPLTVEHRLIAGFVIEGGSLNDFQKFEILASQLALQVKKVQLYETVKEISIVDGLTQVFVRRHFFERFQEELKRALRYQFPLTVLMVDVDHFKSYNDKFGHLVGDKTLREVAQIIRENVRRVDVIGRYGGEEFVIVAPEISRAQGIDLAERIRSAVARKKFQLYDEEAHATVSIGVSSFSENASKHTPHEFMEYLTTLIDQADESMYRAKQEGRNRVVAHG